MADSAECALHWEKKKKKKTLAFFIVTRLHLLRRQNAVGVKKNKKQKKPPPDTYIKSKLQNVCGLHLNFSLPAQTVTESEDGLVTGVSACIGE